MVATPAGRSAGGGFGLARRGAGWMLSVAGAYALAALAGLVFAVPGSAPALVRPSGAVLVVSLAASALPMWPLLLLAGGVAHLVTHPSAPFPVLWTEYGHQCVLAVMAAGLVRLLNGGGLRLNCLRGMAAFVGGAVLAAPAAAAFLTAGLHGVHGSDALGPVSSREFLSDALAVACIGPVGLVLLAGAAPWRAGAWRLGEAALLGLAAAGSGWVAGQGISAGTAMETARTAALLPVLLWAVVRFGPAGAGLTLAGLMVVLLQVGMPGCLDSRSAQVEVQTSQLALLVPVLLLASLVEERATSARRLLLGDTRLSLAMEASNTAIWEWTVRTGTLSWSPAGSPVFGLSQASLPDADSVMALIHPDDRSRARQEAVRAIREGVFEAELRIVRPGGAVRWVRTRGRAHPGPGVAVECLIGVCVDETEWKEADLALRASEARRRAVLAAVPDLMFVQDGEGRYLDYHVPEGAELLVPPEAFLGRRMADVLPPDLAAMLGRCIAEALDTGGPAVADYSLDMGEGQRDYEARLVRCGSDEVLSIVREVTERHRSQAALEKSEEALRALAVRLLAAQDEERTHVAREIHDDAGQLVAMLAFQVDALQRLFAPRPDHAAALVALHEGLDLLADRIRGISHRLHPALLDIAGLATAIRSHCLEAGVVAGIVVHVKITGDAEHLPRGPSLAAYRIVQEALRNVTRHARAKNAWVEVARTEGQLRLTVSDDGCGMSDTASDEPGLGMVSMRERAQLAGGWFGVKSIPGIGTCVIARIPLPPCPDPVAPADR